ncbi:MAG: PQQ-binding-like beta-propeller repeat protein [Planctomycetaceae bacterium]
MFRNFLTLLSASVCVVLTSSSGSSADWPMWRYDAARSAASPEQLPAELKLLWTREFSPRKQAWDDTLNLDLMTYDRLLEPVVAEGRLFLGFNDRDKLTAYDVNTGAELWSYFAAGPVRMPPVVWKDHVFFASDDGYLYCVNVSDGTLNWKFRGGPGDRQILGNQRLISAWPMRGGPVIRDDKVYVAASIWPFMGTFIYALDAETGRVEWVNDETGAQYIKQPHSAPSFAGIAPQGALVATADVLLVPGGRSVPAAFDRHTGKQLYFELNAGGKGTGGSFVAADEDSWFVHTRGKGTREFSLATGVKTAFLPNEPVLAGDHIYSANTVDEQALIQAHDSTTKELIWEVTANGLGDLMLAGDTLYAAGQSAANTSNDVLSAVTAIRLPTSTETAAVQWTVSVPGTVERLIAANGQLFAVTLEGSLLAFGVETRQPTTLKEIVTTLVPDAEAVPEADLLLNSGAAEGYAVWLGAADESLVTAVATKSPFVELRIVDEDSKRVDQLRRQFDAAGLAGRVALQHTPLVDLSLPPYLANMLFVGRELTPGMLHDGAPLRRIYESVRPYGGVLVLLADPNDTARIREQVIALQLEQAEVETTEVGVVVRRAGPLPGAGAWTHQHGNIANTINSSDQRVKLPLGVLWFGGASHNDILPRHGHGPPEQVVGGRLFIQGMNSLTARDVYTGRQLWKRDFEDLGTHDVFFDDTYKNTPLDPAYNQVHIPGANARGTNYVVTADAVYILEGATCHVLDPATGLTMTEISLPQADPEYPHDWGYIGIYQDVLLGGVGFANYRARHEADQDEALRQSEKRAGFGEKSLDLAASMALVGFDRHTGKQLWKVDALHSFWHNGIVAGGGLIYTLDRNPSKVEEILRRRGKSNPDTYRLLAINALTGEKAWELSGQVFGTWLGYSETHGLLLQAGAAASDRLSSEVGQGMAVYRAQTGEVVWQKADLVYSGPCVLHNDLIITNTNSYKESAGAFHLVDGSPKMVKNALTGKLQPWKITRAYGCNNIIASENLLTFRSGAAGFYDLLTEGGTGNFGGFKSGCTSNLVVADGVLNAPDYTRTCSCAYQNQTSLALVHMPEMDVWTISNTLVLDPSAGRVQHLGVNLGAPGDRRDANGLMWLEYPPVAGDSPNLGLEFTGDYKLFQDHPASKAGTPLPWVDSSGVENLTSLRLSLKAQPLPPKEAADASSEPVQVSTNAPETAPEPYRVRLYFGSPHGTMDQERVFDVAVQGQTVLENITVGGNADSALIRTIDRVMVGDWLEITFTAKTGHAVISGIELERLEE